VYSEEKGGKGASPRGKGKCPKMFERKETLDDFGAKRERGGHLWGERVARREKRKDEDQSLQPEKTRVDQKKYRGERGVRNWRKEKVLQGGITAGLDFSQKKECEIRQIGLGREQASSKGERARLVEASPKKNLIHTRGEGDLQECEKKKP